MGRADVQIDGDISDKFGNRPDGNYTEMESDGTLAMAGAATVFNDLRIPISNLRLPAANPPTPAAYKGGQVLSFSSAADNFVYFNVQLPHSYKEGSTIYPHVHYVIPVAGAGGGVENLKWNFTYSWANVNAAFAAETSDSVTIDVQNLAADTHYFQNLTAITGTGKTISSILICALSRDTGVASDYASAAYLVDIDFHFELDTIGSRGVTTK